MELEFARQIFEKSDFKYILGSLGSVSTPLCVRNLENRFIFSVSVLFCVVWFDSCFSYFANKARM